MHKIVCKRQLCHDMFWLEFEAPYITIKAKTGQFVILRIDEYGERIPLTMANIDKEKGTITVIFQNVGRSTSLLSQLEEGDYIHDVVGPLGNPTEMEGLKSVCIVGGGSGNALAYPVAKGLHDAGIKVDMIAGFKTESIVILVDEFTAGTDNFYLMTDDGTAGEKGFTTAKLQELLDAGNQYDEIITVGPPIMMKIVAQATKPTGIPTIASMTAIMIDGTGMCGGCRVTVGGETKYVCVDGPEFDAQQVDWDVLLARTAYFKPEEQAAREHPCRITGGVRYYG